MDDPANRKLEASLSSSTHTALQMQRWQEIPIRE